MELEVLQEAEREPCLVSLEELLEEREEKQERRAGWVLFSVVLEVELKVELEGLLVGLEVEEDEVEEPEGQEELLVSRRFSVTTRSRLGPCLVSSLFGLFRLLAEPVFPLFLLFTCWRGWSCWGCCWWKRWVQLDILTFHLIFLVPPS